MICFSGRFAPLASTVVNGAGISDLKLTGDAFPGTPVVPECYNFRICYVVKFSIASNTCIKNKNKK